MRRAFAAILAVFVLVFSAAAMAGEEFDARALMLATGLDEIFDGVDEGMDAIAEADPLAGNPRVAEAVKRAARAAFVSSQMHDRLAAVLDGKFSAPELADLEAFYSGSLGVEVTELERAAGRLGLKEREAAVAEGNAILSRTAPERVALYDTMFELVSRELQDAMMRHTMRAMMISFVVGTRGSDIAIPWDEIDAQVDQLLPIYVAELEVEQRAMGAYIYRTVSDADMQAYVDFLGTDSARRFYEVTVVALGLVSAEAIEEFGKALGRELRSVGV